MDSIEARTRAALAAVLGQGTRVGSITAIDEGRGVFSHVMRAEVEHTATSSVAVKLLRDDANGRAAVSSGAAAREMLAYREILPASPEVSAPTSYGISFDDNETPAIVLEDLSECRHIDQVDGLTTTDLRAVVSELITLHSAWARHPDLAALDVRHSTPAQLPVEGIERGAVIIDAAWPDVGIDRRQALQALAARHADAVRSFEAQTDESPTLCHGDPRGDNVAFTAEGRAVLLDWQQIAIQFGEADLAWLMATSLDRDTRRAVESDIVASYAMARNQSAATTWQRYVTGMVLPGLAVLFLAQRTVEDERTRRFVTTSIERIADAVVDLGVVDAVAP